jgi:N-acetylglutamate synthase-like GNAT family acetyltransferase
MMKIKVATTQEELDKIIRLRYEILRAPWGQTADTATDDFESKSINAFIEENGRIIACGRLQENQNKVGQIRYMAVSNDHQGRSLGKTIVKYLENKAEELQLEKIELQARENAVEFYKRCGYSVKEKSFLLWGEIQHFLMFREIKN